MVSPWGRRRHEMNYEWTLNSTPMNITGGEYSFSECFHCVACGPCIIAPPGAGTGVVVIEYLGEKTIAGACAFRQNTVRAVAHNVGIKLHRVHEPGDPVIGAVAVI